MKARRGVKELLYSFFNLGSGCFWVVKATPRPLYSWESDLVPIVHGVGGLPGRSGRVRKTSPPPALDSRTVQPLASRYTD